LRELMDNAKELIRSSLEKLNLPNWKELLEYSQRLAEMRPISRQQILRSKKLGADIDSNYV